MLGSLTGRLQQHRKAWTEGRSGSYSMWRTAEKGLTKIRALGTCGIIIKVLKYKQLEL